MRPARTARMIPVLMVFCLLTLRAQAQYSGGSGTANDPYQIATAADLIALGETSDDYDKHFILTADIDLDPNLPGGKVFDEPVIAPQYPFDEVLEEQPPSPSFIGTLDGHGHKISHLTMISADLTLGLFGALGPGAEVGHLNMVDINIDAGSHAAGGLAGGNGGFLIGCSSTGVVKGSEYVGGLIGGNSGTVTQCHSSCTIISATVTSGRNNALGGLVGSNHGSMINCYSTGRVSGRGTEWGGVGGLAGHNWAHIMNCYSTGTVDMNDYVGGLVGNSHDGDVSGCFWDTETSGQVTSAGGIGLDTGAMNQIQTYLNVGWDWIGEIENGTSQIWLMPQGGGYPVLSSFNGYVPRLLQGMGTPEDPYLISNPLELGAVVHYSPFAHYRLAATIDLLGICWSTPIIPHLGSTFDGNSLAISHLEALGGGCLGLFGRVHGSVKNLRLVDVNVVGLGSTVGALVGLNDGDISHCCSTGTVSGDGTIGGLVGENYGSMTASHSTATTVANRAVGGFVGFNHGTITDCHATGRVSGGTQAGGLLGDNSGTIVDCYSQGIIEATLDVGGLVGRNCFNGLVFSCGSASTVAADSNNVGGLVGSNVSGQIDHCYATGAVSSVRRCVGGLVGYNDGPVSCCYATGAITGNEDVGGLVGMGHSNESEIRNSWAGRGRVEGTHRVGGLMGWNSGLILNCYSFGAIEASRTDPCDVGGLVGKNDPWRQARGSFWDIETSNQEWSAGGIGMPTAEMCKGSTFLDAGWDFVDDTENGTEDIWWIDEGKDYPRLRWEP